MHGLGSSNSASQRCSNNKNMENNNQEKIFANGIRFQEPGPKAPQWVKGKISVKVDEFIQFAQEHAKNGWLNLDLKQSKKGVLYLELNTWQKGDAPRGGGAPVENSQGRDDGGFDQYQGQEAEIQAEESPF